MKLSAVFNENCSPIGARPRPNIPGYSSNIAAYTYWQNSSRTANTCLVQQWSKQCNFVEDPVFRTAI